jgi:hypothetical protein
MTREEQQDRGPLALFQAIEDWGEFRKEWVRIATERPDDVELREAVAGIADGRFKQGGKALQG